jgi:ankyrin repeat protein
MLARCLLNEKHLVACFLVGVWSTAVLVQEREVSLIDAVRRHDIVAARTLLERGVSPDVGTPDGNTPLHWAAYGDDLALADLLIASGADVNASTVLGVTPLSLACTNRSAAIAARLLAAGANANAALSTGETVLMTAARTGSLEIVRGLLARGADVNAREGSQGQTALMWAVASRHAEIVHALIDGGADIEARTKVRSVPVHTGDRFVLQNDRRGARKIDQGGFTALLFAARHGDVESARLLLAAGADVNETSADGASALVVAAHSGHRSVSMLLLEKGADPNAAEAGYSALHAAILKGDRELVKALLAHGADPNAPLEKGTPTRRYSADFALSAQWIGATPFWLAARFLEPEMMSLLVAGGADPRFVMSDGSTALLVAVQGSTSRAPLGERRERYQIVDEDDIQKETESRVFEAVKIAGPAANVNQANKAGDTALHAAAAKGYSSVVQWLVDHGAQLDVENAKGHTPLMIAIAGMKQPAADEGEGRIRSFQSTVELLRKLGAKE